MTIMITIMYNIIANEIMKTDRMIIIPAWPAGPPPITTTVLSLLYDIS